MTTNEIGALCSLLFLALLFWGGYCGLRDAGTRQDRETRGGGGVLW